MPREEQAQDALIVRYLLGGLPEDQAAEVEDRAFADEGYLAEIQAAEADLIDAFVRGELPEADRRSFEHRFLASPQRRSKVEFARTLTRLADQYSGVPAVRETSSPLQALINLIRGWNPGLQFAAGLAALVCVVGVSWLLVHDSQMRSQVAALQEQTGALQRQLDEERKRPAPQGTAAPVAALTLLPGLPRSESSKAQLVLHAGAQLARIEIQLEARDDYPRFRAELRTVAGEEILTNSNLRSRRNAGGLTVTFEVPVTVLANDQYELSLKGLPADEPSKDIGYYYFSVLRR